MYLLKGLLIFSPIFISTLLIHRTFKYEKLVTLLLAIILFTATLTPISFVGWLIDYSFFFITATLIFKILIARWTKTFKIFTQAIVTLLFFGYVGLNSFFGARLIDKYEKSGLTFKLYEIPDMVSFSTYRLEIEKTWLVFEKQVYKKQVQSIKCRYDFNLVIEELVATEDCR